MNDIVYKKNLIFGNKNRKTIRSVIEQKHINPLSKPIKINVQKKKNRNRKTLLFT